MPRSKKHERERYKKRLARLIRLELDPELKGYLKDKSDEIGISQSQIVEYLVMLDRAGASPQDYPLAKYLEHSKSPAWRYRLNKDRLRRDLG